MIELLGYVIEFYVIFFIFGNIFERSDNYLIDKV